MYYKPMGDPPYISSKQASGLIMRSWLIYEYTIYQLWAEEWVHGLITHHGLIIHSLQYMPFVQSPGAIAPGITGDLSSYEVTFVPDTGVPMVVAVDLSVCSAGVCQYKLQIDGSPPSSFSFGTVSGMNTIGIGAARVCTSQTISKSMQ